MMTIKTENWLGEFVSTIGTGDAILGGAIDGFAGFSNVGDDVDVYYTIIDGLDKETGIGTLTGGKLVRKDIHATLVDGAYVKNGSAINLSGDAQVYGTANAHFLDYVQAVVNAEIVNTQEIAELKALRINGHALTASFNLTAADVGAHPDSWMPSTEDLSVYQKAASDIRYLKTQDAEQVAGLVMRVGGARDQQLQQSINEALRRSYADAGYNLVDGSFEAGGTLVSANDVLLQERTGKAFSGPAGTVSAGTDPTSGGFTAIEIVLSTVPDYAGLRAYAGQAKSIYVTGVVGDAKPRGISGYFALDASDATSADNGGTIIVDASNRRWKRNIETPMLPQWFGGDPNGVIESSGAITACANAAKTALLKANYAGKWNLNKTVIVGDEGNTTGSQRISYTSTGRIIFSGTKSMARIKQPSSILPVNAEFGINAGSEARPIVHNEFFINQSYNNQGLAYHNGYYYVGYDLGGGNGMVEKYFASGKLDTSFGGVAIPINHAAEVAVRFSTGRVYVASGGGAEPTYIRELAADGKSVSQSIDLTAYGNSALCAIDNQNDIIILHSTLTGGDGGLPTFTFFNFGDYTNPIKQFTLSATLGVPQGMDVFEGTIYFYTNNKITLISYDGEIQGSFTFSVTGESEGLAICSDYGNAYIAVGYNTPRRVMTIRSPHAAAVRNVNFMGTANSNLNGNTSLVPMIIPFSIRKSSAAAGAGWALTTYAAGDHPRFENLFLEPTIDSASKWLALKLRCDPIGCVFSANAQFALNTFGFTTWPLQVMCDVKGAYPSYLTIGFVDGAGVKVDPATITGTGIIWGHAVVGVRYNVANY